MTVRTQNHSRSIYHGAGWLVMFLVLSQMSLHATAQNNSPPIQTVPNPFGGKLDKRMAVIMVILIAVFVVLAFLSVYTRQCADRRLRGRMDLAIAIGGGSSRRSRVVRGLDAAVIDTFPTFVYSTVKGLKIGKGSLECAVCLNEFEDDETLRLLPKCSHVFHTDCIDAWLASHSTCPVCRANLAPRPGEIPIPCAVLQISDPYNDSVQPDQRSDTDETQIHDADNQRRELESESPEVNLVNPSQRTNQNRPPWSRSTGFGFAGIFPRSHSTGHSLVQPGENFDRFTLRLPDEVRSRLMNSTLNRANSCVAFPRVRSSRRGYRSASGGTGRARNFFYERFDRSDRRGFSFTPPFISRSASVRSPKVESGYEGEQSSDLLRHDPQV